MYLLLFLSLMVNFVQNQPQPDIRLIFQDVFLIATTRMRPDDFSEDMQNIKDGIVPPPDEPDEESQDT